MATLEDMRTTLTLDDDLAITLRKRAEELGVTWKQVVNDVLREGLASVDGRDTGPAERYETPVSDPGPPSLPGVHSVHDMLAYAEGESYR